VLLVYEFVQICAFLLLSPLLRLFRNEKSRRFIFSRQEENFFQSVLEAKEPMNKDAKQKRRIWVHVASAGELEQAIPPIRGLVDSGIANVFLTYFSPSTEPFLKNASFVSGYSAFPLDVRKFHNKILSELNITDIVFVRYDFWPALFSAAKTANIKLHLLGATPLPSRRLFSLLGGNLVKKQFLKQFSTIFTVNKNDINAFQSVASTSKVLHAGDPKWARAKERAQILRENKLSSKHFWLLSTVEEIKSRRSVIVFGSPHAEEHLVATQLVKQSTPGFYIYVPHECDDAHVNPLIAEFNRISGNVARLSELSPEKPLPIDAKVLVVDKIGFLAEIYSLANIAIVGGGFDGQIHNTLEPAAHPVPTLFGNNVRKAPEAQALLLHKAALGFSSPSEMLEFLLEPKNHMSRDGLSKEDLLNQICENSSRLFQNTPDTCSIIKNQFMILNNNGAKTT
jgi:3-deoxy-D-manno-octulosonic-acid transferase